MGKGLGRAAIVVLTIAGLVAVLGDGAARASGWTKCPAVTLSGGTLHTLPDVAVLTGGAGDDTAFFIQTRGASCPEAQQLLGSVLQASDESTALAAGGYRLLQARTERRLAGHATHRVEASKGAARLRYWRFGARIGIDHSIFRPGQWIDIPAGNGYEKCTASWVLEPRAGGALEALTAGHCVNVLDQVYREVDGARTTIIGTVAEQAPQVDAEVFELTAPSGWAQQVERGGKPPKTAVGWVKTVDQHIGDHVCFAGRSTGADQCGRIVKHRRRAPKREICTDIEGHQGDSGGPVYTDTSGATTRAVGIVAVISGHIFSKHLKMCSVPIQPILDAFQADFG